MCIGEGTRAGSWYSLYRHVPIRAGPRAGRELPQHARAGALPTGGRQCRAVQGFNAAGLCRGLMLPLSPAAAAASLCVHLGRRDLCGLLSLGRRRREVRGRRGRRGRGGRLRGRGRRGRCGRRRRSGRGQRRRRRPRLRGRHGGLVSTAVCWRLRAAVDRNRGRGRGRRAVRSRWGRRWWRYGGWRREHRRGGRGGGRLRLRRPRLCGGRGGGGRGQ